jgi:hypothetical protein
MPKDSMNDLVVLLPGITGSVLVDKNGRELWAVSGQALWNALATKTGSLKALKLAEHEPGEPAPDDGVRATRLVTGFHGILGFWKIDGYENIASTIRETFNVTEGLPGDDNEAVNFLHFPYDWRRSNIEAAHKLRSEIERRLPAWRKQTFRPDARVILIAHSMGGLVARYYLEVLHGWRTCRALITFGTPFGGSLDALGYLVNGYKKAGVIDLSDALQSMPSVYELLPRYPAVRKNDQYHRIGEISDVAKVCPKRASIALEGFHRAIDRAIESNENDSEYKANRYRIIPYIGIEQPTWQSADLHDGVVELLRNRPPIVPEILRGGDGTVPRASATPPELTGDYRETFFIQKHAALQNYLYALTDLGDRLKQMQAPNMPLRGSALTHRRGISLDIDDFYAVDEPVELRARLTEGEPNEPLEAIVDRVTAPVWRKRVPVPRVGAGYVLILGALDPGRYKVTLRSTAGGEGAASAATSVNDLFEVGV